MIKTARSITLASVIGVLSALPAAGWADSTGPTPSDPAALRAFFHSAAFNLTDALNDYTEDLSAYGTHRKGDSVSQQVEVAVARVNGAAEAALDLVAVREFFHSPAFNLTDELDDYTEDLSSRKSTVARLRQ